MPIKSLFDEALEAEGVKGKLADVARSIYTQESGAGKNTARSNRGAVGGMQILPSTFRSVADAGWSVDDPLQNIRGGLRYLKLLSKQAGGDPALVAAGYYGGPGGLEKARQGIAVSDPKNPGAPNTLQYASQVVARAGLRPSSLAANDSAVIPPDSPTPAPAASAVVASRVEAQPMTVAVASPAIAPVETVTPQASGPDPWQEFLRQVSAVPAQSSEPLAANDLSFGPRIVSPAPMVQAPRAVVPNFQAFTAWGGKAA